MTKKMVRVSNKIRSEEGKNGVVEQEQKSDDILVQFTIDLAKNNNAFLKLLSEELSEENGSISSEITGKIEQEISTFLNGTDRWSKAFSTPFCHAIFSIAISSDNGGKGRIVNLTIKRDVKTEFKELVSLIKTDKEFTSLYTTLVNQMEIGVELEFSNNETQKWGKIKNFEKCEDLNTILNSWVELLENKECEVWREFENDDELKELVKQKKELVVVGYPKTGNGRHGSYEMKWAITVDYGVIEIVIKKCSLSKYSAYKEILAKDIYGVAKKIGLKIKQDGGYLPMTHINVDFKTGFFNDYRLVLNTLFHLEENVYLKTTVNEGKSVILLNSPTIKEILDKDYEEWKKQFDNIDGNLSYQYISNRMKEYTKKIKGKNQNLFKNNFKVFVEKMIDPKDNNKKEETDEILLSLLHYRAVNIEHLDTTTHKPMLQRVEFRRYIAASTYDETLTQIQDLCKTILDQHVLHSLLSGERCDAKEKLKQLEPFTQNYEGKGSGPRFTP